MPNGVFISFDQDQALLDEGININDQDDINIDESYDIVTTDESLEESFANRVENLSLDDLKIERDKLIEMGALDGEEISLRYEAFLDEQRKNDEFSSLIGDLSKEQLEHLKGNILEGDEKTIELLGLADTNDGEESTTHMTKSLRLEKSDDI